MKIDLYPCFEHLKQFNTIWLYSDPHFGDEEMKYLRKDYIGDDEQVKRINSKVGKKDVIIILGDIGDVNQVSKLRGYKILVLGNHDKGKTSYQKMGNNGLFDEIYAGIVALNEKIILSHEPIYLPFMFNIHGHDHSNTESFADNLHLNICAEHINYTPISLNELIKSGVFKDVHNIHRITIDAASKRKDRKQFDKQGKNKPNWDDVYKEIDGCPAKIFEHGREYKCYGYIIYEGNNYPVYTDDFSYEDFIIYRYRDKYGVIKEHQIVIRNIDGILNWWHDLNMIKEKCPDETII